MTKTSAYAFYGSLRQGMYNHELFKSHLEYLSTKRLPGFKLYALTRYPIAVRTDMPRDFITVELFRITNSETEKKIHQIEMDAGYYFDEVKVREISAGIYLFHDPKNFPVVPDGDWVKYTKNNLI